MKWSEDSLAMREYLTTIDKVEKLRDEFRVGTYNWLSMDCIITSYMRMWAGRYDRGLNAPKWLWEKE